MLKVYSDWVENANYDSDLLQDGYGAPYLTAKYFTESYPEEKRREIKILDLGAGTGLVARELLKQGFCHIDALDPSEAMMSVAKEDGLYEDYICEFMTDKHLPVAPDTYDGVTACSSFGINHVPPEALFEVIRIVKPGGMIVIVSRADCLSTVPYYKDQLLPLMERLETEGKWKRVLAETTGHYYLEAEAIIWKFQVLEKSLK